MSYVESPQQAKERRAWQAQRDARQHNEEQRRAHQPDREELTRRVSSVLDGTALTENDEVVDAIVGSVLRFREESRREASNDPMAIERLRTIVAEALDGPRMRPGVDIPWREAEPIVHALTGGPAYFERAVNGEGVSMRRVHVVTGWEMDPLGSAASEAPSVNVGRDDPATLRALVAAREHDYAHVQQQLDGLHERLRSVIAEVAAEYGAGSREHVRLRDAFTGAKQSPSRSDGRRPHCEVADGPCPGNPDGVICGSPCEEDQAVPTRIINN